jgi:hypothetical protein
MKDLVETVEVLLYINGIGQVYGLAIDPPVDQRVNVACRPDKCGNRVAAINQTLAEGLSRKPGRTGYQCVCHVLLPHSSAAAIALPARHLANQESEVIAINMIKRGNHTYDKNTHGNTNRNTIPQHLARIIHESVA